MERTANATRDGAADVNAFLKRYAEGCADLDKVDRVLSLTIPTFAI